MLQFSEDYVKSYAPFAPEVGASAASLHDGWIILGNRLVLARYVYLPHL